MTAPGEDMRSHLRALLDDHDGEVRAFFRRDLLEANGGGEARRTGADDDHVEIHRFTGGQIGHGLLLATRSAPGIATLSGDPGHAARTCGPFDSLHMNHCVRFLKRPGRRAER